MNNQIDYGRFSRVRNVLNDDRHFTLDEKERAFKSLVRCLVDKHVFRIDGKVVRDRLSCLEYLEEICQELEYDELDLLLSEPNIFYAKFVFAPSKSVRSLFSALPDVKAKIRRVSKNELFEMYIQTTGYSPYEKVSKDVLKIFLDDVEALYA